MNRSGIVLARGEGVPTLADALLDLALAEAERLLALPDEAKLDAGDEAFVNVHPVLVRFALLAVLSLVQT